MNKPLKTLMISFEKRQDVLNELIMPNRLHGLLFLKYLDGLEQDKAAEAMLEVVNIPIFLMKNIAGVPVPLLKMRMEIFAAVFVDTNNLK